MQDARQKYGGTGNMKRDKTRGVTRGLGGRGANNTHIKNDESNMFRDKI